jgi:hypothetical protein
LGGEKIKRPNILRGAVVLLVAMAMVFSSIAIAETKIKQTKIDLITNDEGMGVGAFGDIVWDNGMNYDGLLAAQYDSTDGFDAYPADDFHFEEETEVCDVHWIGGYYNPDQHAEYEWCIAFYNDRGDGNAPGSLYAGPYCYAWADINWEELEPGRYEMWVDLPENIPFPPCYKFWILIWANGVHPPQSGWGYHEDPIYMHQAVFKSDYFGFPDWVDVAQVTGFPFDMCFQLTTKPECDPCIDVEKYVWDPNNQEWVDADDETSAIDLPVDEDITFKIVIHNCGDVDLYEIIVNDKMHDSLEYLAGDPEPDQIYYEEPFWYMDWYFPGPLPPCAIIELYITAKPVQPDSYDFNHVLVRANGCGNPVQDEDWCWVHGTKVPKSFNMPFFLRLFERFPNMFPVLRQILAI